METWSSCSTQCLSGCIWSAVPCSSPTIQSDAVRPERIQRAGKAASWGKTQHVMSFRPWRKLRWISSWYSSTQREQCLSLRIEPCGAGKGQWVQVAQGEIWPWCKKIYIFFYSKNNPSLEQPHQGCGGIPIPGGFQDAVGQCYIGAHWLPSPTEGCWSFEVPSNLGHSTIPWRVSLMQPWNWEIKYECFPLQCKGKIW